MFQVSVIEFWVAKPGVGYEPVNIVHATEFTGAELNAYHR